MTIYPQAPALVPLVDEGHCPDILISGIARIEKLVGGLVRIVCYIERQDEAGNTERVIAARVVRPLATLPAALHLLWRALGDSDVPLVAEGGQIKPLN